MKHIIKKMAVGMVLFSGVASIICSLFALAGLGSNNEYTYYGDLLFYGGFAIAFAGQEILTQELWQGFNKSRNLCLCTRISLLSIVVIIGAVSLRYRVKVYGYDVLPEGISVPIGNTTYSTLVYGTFFLVAILDVFFLTRLPKQRKANSTTSMNSGMTSYYE